MAIGMKEAAAYRGRLLLSVLNSAFSIAAFSAVWAYVYRGEPCMASRMAAYVVASSILTALYTNTVAADLGEKIRTGSLSSALLRPKGIVAEIWGITSGRILVRLLLVAFPLVLLCSSVLKREFAGWAGLALTANVCAVNLVFLLACHTLIAYSSFVVTDNEPFVGVFENLTLLFSGSVIPVQLYPDALRRLSHLLPFHLQYDFPIRILLGTISQEEIVTNYCLLLFWTLVALGCLALAHRRLMWEFVTA